MLVPHWTLAAVPAVDNALGADVQWTSAVLNGTLADTGGLSTQVRVYWGSTDGGTVIANWDHEVNLGTKPVGPVSLAVTGLVPGQTYHYRFYATNLDGAGWAAPTADFTTLVRAGPAPVNLGSTAHFAILAGAAITTTGGGTIKGDVGASPIAGAAIAIPSELVDGIIYSVDATCTATSFVIDPALLTTAKGDLTIAYNDAAGRTPIPSGPELNPTLAGATLAPGLYKFTGQALLTGSDLTLSGGPEDVWIFQITSDLQVDSGRAVILAGGAQAKNIFWQVGTSAVLGTSTSFKGTIIADQAITMMTSSTIEGRALAFSAGVTYNGSAGTLPASGNPPVAAPDYYSVTQDTTLTVPLPGILANDSDPDADVLVPVLVDDVSNGILVLDPNGSFAYTPTPGWSGTDTFTYKASDGALQSSDVTVTLEVNPTFALTVNNGTGSGEYLAGRNIPVIATIPVGKIFDGWTGDTTHLADASAASTIATMPALDIAVTATFVDAPPATYALTVVNGTGSGSFAEGAFAPVIATVPVGKVFDAWTGDTVYLTDPAAASTIATMPAFPIAVTATFVDAPPDTYTLTVINGTGSGPFVAGALAPVIATVPVGKVFSAWAGDIGYLTDATAASTIATMPDVDITITAVFVDAPPATYTLTVVNGTGSGAFVEGASAPVIATVPVGKVFSAWAGDTGHLADAALASTIATMPAFPITVTALFVDAPPATYTLTVVNGTGSGPYAAGTVVPVVATVPIGKVFSAWAGDVGALANPALASTTVTMPAVPVTVTALFVDAPPATYTLTVVNGTGSGAYIDTAVVPISAVVPVGSMFDRWTGDTAYLADPDAATTSATMPAFAITVAARVIAVPPWYPHIPWTAVGGIEWYYLQVWDDTPDTPGSNLVLETNVKGTEMTPAREYFLAGSDGLLPGTYFWRYAAWTPETDTYGSSWLPSAAGQSLVVGYGLPDTPTALSCTPNPGAPGNFELSFLAINAQGYDLEITTGVPTSHDVLLTDHYFMPGEDRVVPFNRQTLRPITLTGPNTYAWRVRGFNPLGESAWVYGPDIVVNAGTTVPFAEIPDYRSMRPTDGWVVAAPNGTAELAFQWEAVPGAAGYMIYVSSASGAPVLNYVDVGNVTRVDAIDGARIALPPNTYLWSLIAYNAAEPREYGGWNHSARTPDQESAVVFQVVADLKAPTVTDAARGVAANTVDITWVGTQPATVDVMLFRTGTIGWVTALDQPVTETSATTGTIPLGSYAWGAGPDYLLLTGRTVTGETGPRSRLFLIPSIPER
jgi:hypothetical protein